MEKLKKIEEIKKYGKKTRGKRFLLLHLEGKKLTPKQAIWQNVMNAVIIILMVLKNVT